MEEARASLVGIGNKEQNISALVNSLHKYVTRNSLHREMVVELIDSITVTEQYNRDDAKQQDITINYGDCTRPIFCQSTLAVLYLR